MKISSRSGDFRSPDVRTTTSMNCKNQDGSLSEIKRNDGSLNGK